MNRINEQTPFEGNGASSEALVRRPVRFLLPVLFLSLSGVLLHSAPRVQSAKIVASDGVAGNAFGTAVATSGDTVVVGAYGSEAERGAAYVFVRNGSYWSEQQKLLAPDGVTGDRFGFAVAISGETVIVGAPNRTNKRGAVYVFTRAGATWTWQQTIINTNTRPVPADNDQFGYSVALDGDTALIGALGANGNRGLAFVWTRSGGVFSTGPTLSDSTGGTWPSLFPAYQPPGGRFGASIALSGDTAVVGQPGAGRPVAGSDNRGSFTVYSRAAGLWSFTSSSGSSGDAAGDQFGSALALSGDTLLVGAPGADSLTGAAYAVLLSSLGTRQKLSPSVATGQEHFGSTVALNGDTAVIGAPGQGSSLGTVYVFGRTDAGWTQQTTLVGTDSLASDSVGASVAMTGDTILAGAPGNASTGAVFVFRQPRITVTSNPVGATFTASGAGCPSEALTTPYVLPAGATCTIAFPPPSETAADTISYTFDGWHDGDSSNPRTLPASAEATYSARLSVRYKLTTAALPDSGGQVTPSGSSWHSAGAPVTLTATPSAGFLFNGFSGGASGSANPFALTMDEPKNVAASFIPMPVTQMTGAISLKTGPQTHRAWNISLTNNGPGIAYTPQINGLVLKQTYGGACAPVRVSPVVFPLLFPDMAVGGGGSAWATFDFTGCPANARFSVVVVFTANNGSSGGATTLANQTM